MKTSRAILFATAALAVGFFTARWCAAQSTNQPSSKGPVFNDFDEIPRLKSFLVYLNENHQTNALQQFRDYSHASNASRDYAEIEEKMVVLRALRSGRTNEAYQTLDGLLDASIMEFAKHFRELPASVRDSTNLKLIEEAKAYRDKYPAARNQIEEKKLKDAFNGLLGKE